MNRQIARLGVVLLAAYAVLFVQLNRLTIFGAEELQNDPQNTRSIQRDFDAPRGSILSADGVLLAQSVPTAPGDPFDRQREYPQGELFAHVTGYFSLELGRAGLEESYNDELAGRTLDLRIRDLADIFVERERVGDLHLHVRSDAQLAAANGLGDRPGAVVALDPRTGAVLALYSSNTYDPNVLASHDFDAVRAVKALVDADPDTPLLPTSYRERFFPGSTFKVVTAAAGLSSGEVTVDAPSYPIRTEYVPPQTSRPLSNFGRSACGGTLIDILRVSCNTAFAQMAVEVGPDTMIETAEAFGFNDRIPVDLPAPAPSNFPTDFDENLPALAQSGIGQNDVSATPLQMAVVAATVANGGVAMRPIVVDEVTDDEGRVVDHNDPRSWRRPIDPETAATLRSAMEAVVASGTATRLQIPGFVVGAKTGTAQLGTTPPRSHAWVIAYAGPPGETPIVAVAVLVEATDDNSGQTGGRNAAPIARRVIEAILAQPDV